MGNISEYTSKLDLLLDATTVGMQNILTNKAAIITIILLVVVIRLFYRVIGKIRWVIYLLIAGGYGSVLIDGIKEIAIANGITTDNIVAMVTEVMKSVT